MKKTLIIIPAHNEEGALPGVIKSVETFSPETDVLIINDASTDNTSIVARNLITPLKIAVLDLPYNLGIGGAMQTGLIYAKTNGYNMACQIDGDGQHPAKFIKLLKRSIVEENADMVIGSRFIMAKGFKAYPLRRFGIRYFSILIKLLTGFAIYDVTSGFRAFGQEAINAFSEYYPQDYPEVESLVIAKKLGFKVMEKPVVMRRRKHGVSTISLIKGIYYMFRVTIGIFICSMRDFKKI